MKKRGKNRKQITGFDLQPRKIPEQRRAEETVLLILETSAQILDEKGIEGFNTNLLAERAGLRIASIYRYFPNKLAILTSLVQQWWDSMRDQLVVDDLANPECDWREFIRSFIDTYASIARSQNGFFAIRRAMQATPVLREIEKNMVRELTIRMVTMLRKRGIQIERKRLSIIIEIFLMSGAALYDLAWLKGRSDKDSEGVIINELKLMSINYLAVYLD